VKNYRRIWAVARFEFARYFKWKQELLTLGLMLVVFLLATAWPAVATLFEKERRIAFVAEGALPEQQGIVYTRIAPEESESALAALGERWDGVLLPDGETLALRVADRASWQEDVAAGLAGWLRSRRLESLPLDEGQRALLLAEPQIRIALQDEGESPQSGGGFVAVALIPLLAVGLMSGAALMMMAITAEKQQRVTEQLLTVMTAGEWMLGKIIGITLFGLKTVLSTGVVLISVFALGALVTGGDFTLPEAAPLPLLNALLFLVLGLLLANCFLAGFSATVDDPQHSSRGIVMFLPMLPIVFCFSVQGSPNSALSVFLSLFPLTSYVAMPVRMAEAVVPLWQWVLSLALLLGTIWGMRNMAVRLFAMGIQSYGKEPGWGDIWRAIKGGSGGAGQNNL